MTPVFLDTVVGLLAIWDVDDQWHTAAEAAYREMMSRNRTVVTTTFVLLECGNAASRRTYRGDVCELRTALEDQGDLIVPTEEDRRTAWQAYGRSVARPVIPASSIRSRSLS